MAKVRIYLLSVGLALAFGLVLAFAGRASATGIDPANMHIVCTGTTICSPAGGIFATQSTTSGLPTFNLTSVGTTGLDPGTTGTAFLAVLVPNGPLSFAVNGSGAAAGAFVFSSGTMWAALGESGAAAVDTRFTSLAVVPGVTSFDAYDYNLGAFNTSGTTIPVSFGGISSFPTGTVFIGFLEQNTAGTGKNANAAFDVVNRTPNSEALTISPVPEPSSLSFLALGLPLVGTIRRRLKAV